ncbi:MAG TPA: hypothetical protein HPP97_06535 [Desulfuromonadales bacterium]|nr:hypothetical protein [Desulfuromonadales bacterium]
MHIKRICLFLTVTLASPAFAANSITFYRDGALLQQEAVAQKGVIDLPLSADVLEHTLTVVPAAGTSIIDVETVRKETGENTEKELEAMIEQRRKLEDRLQALDAREAIFTTAAKSQSGKAPRKTKANPDPMQAIRQGTDFAIAQLEAVYTARRKTTLEIKKVDARIAASRKSTRLSTTSLKIGVSPHNGNVTIRYATAERGWQAHYNLFTEKNGTARLQLSARIKGAPHGYQVRISPGLLAEYTSAEIVPVQAGSVVIANYRLPVADEHSSEGIYYNFSGRLTNSTPHYLPPGESGLYRDGAYRGKFKFEGISSGRSRVISFGK